MGGPTEPARRDGRLTRVVTDTTALTPEARAHLRKGARHQLAKLKPGPAAIEVVKRAGLGVFNDGFIHAGNLAYLALMTVFPFFITAAAVLSLLGQSAETQRAVSSFLHVLPPNVADILRKYLSGKGTLVAQSIAAMVPEYRGTRIGAYLALIGGNVTIPRDPLAALGFYDIARLEAPGTIVEEAALRRSLAIAVEDGDAKRGVEYAQRYARRFLHSPYASQFADLLVSLEVKRSDSLGEDAIVETFAMMDAERQKEAYLRLSRLAAISGKDSLARMAALKAKTLSSAAPDQPEAQANLYESLSNIGTPDVVSAIETIGQIPETQLSDRDRALRDAARAIAEQVVRPPSLSGADVDAAALRRVLEVVRDLA